MKKIGLIYFCTKNAFSRLISSLEKQNIFFPSMRSFPAYLATDGSREEIPEFLREYFQDIFFCHPWVKSEGQVHFNFSMLRNTSIDAALALGLDGIFFADSDTIIARLDIPDNLDFGNPNVYWQKDAGEPVEQSALNIISEQNPFSNGNSWFYLSSKVFSRYRFNEKIFGYGYEDIDFCVRVENEFKMLTGVCGTVIHNFHSTEERKVDPAQYARNKFIFQSTKRAIATGYSITNQQISAYRAIHPHWQCDIIIDHDEQRFRRIAISDGGRLVRKEDGYLFLWDNSNWGAEQFVLLGGELRFKDVTNEQES